VLVWCLAGVAGVILASAIPELKALGMDFAFTAAFIAIARIATLHASAASWRTSSRPMPELSSAPVRSCTARHAAVDHQLRARHVAGRVGCEEEHAVRDVVSLPSSA
jgi:hypothetical protein